MNVRLNIKTVHLVFGITVFVVFLLTGQYMDAQQPPVRTLDDATRMMFRSRHIYILMCALVNVAFGIYLVAHNVLWSRVLQVTGSAVIIMATTLSVAAFFYEAGKAGLPRPLTLPVMILIATGTLLHLFSGIRLDNQV